MIKKLSKQELREQVNRLIIKLTLLIGRAEFVLKDFFIDEEGQIILKTGLYINTNNPFDNNIYVKSFD